jgi:transcriptional regulator NrdR family protein
MASVKECCGEVRVIDKRPAPRGTIRRRMVCRGCGRRWSTYEVLARLKKDVVLPNGLRLSRVRRRACTQDFVDGFVLALERRWP